MAAKRHRLAQRRKTVGFTQEGLAERLGVDSTTVRRWESGETESGPQPWLRPKLARWLQVSVEQLEELLNEDVNDPESRKPLSDSVQPRPADERGKAELLNIDPLVRTLLPVIVNGRLVFVPLGGDIDTSDWDITSPSNSRSVLGKDFADVPGEKRQHTAAESTGSEPAAAVQNSVIALPALRWASDPMEACQSAVALWEYELEDCALAAVDTTELSLFTLHWLVAPRDSPVFRGTGLARVGHGDVQRVRDMRCQLKALDDSYGGGTAFPMAITYLRREVVPLLRGHYDDATGRILFAAIAELMLDIGWMAYDAGAYALAWRYMVQALRLSHAVENRLFGGRVLAAMSHQALHLQYVPLAVDLIRAAREGTKQIASPKAQAMLAAMEACAQAAYQRAESCISALREAENALAHADADDPDWLDFDQGGFAGHAARALRDLRQSREAEHHAVTSLALCHAGHSRTRAQRHTILATTQLQLGDVEAAAATGLLIIPDAWRLHSSRVHSELAALIHSIESIGSTATRDFVEQGRDFLAARVR
ncbi:MAG: helix-turn-helix transcriptional regulator [Gammaproteobacteria bacterium]